MPWLVTSVELPESRERELEGVGRKPGNWWQAFAIRNFESLRELGAVNAKARDANLNETNFSQVSHVSNVIANRSSMIEATKPQADISHCSTHNITFDYGSREGLGLEGSLWRKMRFHSSSIARLISDNGDNPTSDRCRPNRSGWLVHLLANPVHLPVSTRWNV
ncbi:hypothetical protein M405DRAFT_845618 [Rhizopogon salebrosus TDB-379]|nr:hypothetical protein M405DRAFT_845618 [Rhizopogon salebrosus TDB-379]